MSNLIILDADGVFMNEMPYWKAALAAALNWHGLRAGSAADWESLASACFRPALLQRVTKPRGCNSNWDLAAVLVRALDSADLRSRIGTCLGNRAWDSAGRELTAACDALYSGNGAASPPLAAFGIDRYGSFFREVVAAYQDVYWNQLELDWPFAHQELAAPADELSHVFGTLLNMGYVIGVCTSRDRDETVEPMQALGVLEWFEPQRIVTNDEILIAEKLSGIRPLQKPHWFPLACAMVGSDASIKLLANEQAPEVSRGGQTLFVGDASADFEAALACRRRGFALEYAHIDSGLTDAASLERICSDSITLGSAADLKGVLALLNGSAA